ncbi:Uu.00g034310.m01.CDS01 [Anthostomella pinea]|uniref:Uu.00g034310.m01.CDS01 n=1 Tax=Anthostomella pinea TaxID=933095 RepID=A0AAI8V940_9PEZI|nr:Uu.00g034310.m01.CDS01 [Anthostomella pinea]
MSAPYWGQLPPPKARRISDQYDQTNHSQSRDQSASQAQPRSNRTSSQTANTDAPTESTFTPLASPTTSNYQGSGLAPRPPSLPYGHNTYPQELLEKRRRRTSRDQPDEPPESTTSPPPAAPDVPRAPPVSYKDPYGNGGQAYTFNAAGRPGPPRSTRSSGPQPTSSGMEPESFYKDATPPAEKQDRAPVLDRDRPRFDEGGFSSRAVGRDTGTSGSTRRHTNGHTPGEASTDPSSSRRRESQNADTQRKLWADDRSPLQRLELTLDSITKEEKRARVEAAEQRARERATQERGKAVDRGQHLPERPAGQQVRFRDPRQPVENGNGKRAIVTDPVEDRPSAATKNGSLAQHRPEEDRPYKPSGQSPRSQIPVATNRNIPGIEKTSLPQRNLSFRERAANNDLNILKDPSDSSSPTSPVTTPGGGLALARSGSNKLKKKPPGDPWFSVRGEAEEGAAFLNRRKAEAANGPPGMFNNVPIRARPTGGTNEKHPQPAGELDRPPARGESFQGHGDFEESPPSRLKGFAAAIGLGRSNSMGANRQPQQPQGTYGAPARGFDDPPSRRNGTAATPGLGRANSMGTNHQPAPRIEEPHPPTSGPNVTKSVTFPDPQHEARVFEEDDSDASSQDHDHGLREYMHRGNLKPGQGMYQPPQYLDEWKKGTTGTLSGTLLEITGQPGSPADTNKAWWEGGGKRRKSMSTRPQKAEAFDGEYDDTQAPTRFKPPLHLKCGPLLRYCGIRHEKPVVRTGRNDLPPDREIWRGSVMIVTQDSDSSYEIAPTLRLFVQPIELLPPPPAELRGELLPEYVDPIAGMPKLGRRGETLYVRPVEHLEESKDASKLGPDDGLFETTRTAPDFNSNAPDPHGSFTSRKRRTEVDGEKVGKYKDVRGFRLHTERGHTFWRFNIEVELRDKQQRIAYRINRGPATGFWVPARGQSMNVMFHSCNGFSLSVNTDELSGPDPMWRDVLNNHQTRPFHVMVGGGDQVYNDAVMRKAKLFEHWLQIKNPLHKNNAPFTADMQDEMEVFYLERYMMWFSQGLFGLATSQIPMVNMYDDHDIIDGFGSYPHHFMKSPVFTGLGNVAFKYYMLFQHQSLPVETEQTEPSWVLGVKPGPYIKELSRSMFMSLGAGVALLAVDCRTERTRDEVVREDTWERIKDRCYDEIIKSETHHLLVLLGVPIAYPRLVWLENILTSRLMDPIKALGKVGMLGNFLNHFDGGVEVLDDLDDHWTAKNHKDERKMVVEDLQDLAADKSVRVTILSGDVHLAAIGEFYSNPKLHIAKHKDFRYMPNIISSAIANTPPPDLMADVLNKRNKIHHFDKETDEDMIPIFTHGVDGKPRNNKRLLPHRNWCSIRAYAPEHTPPTTPPAEYNHEYTPEGTPPGSRGGILRRFSLSKNRGPALRPDVPKDSPDRSRPPITGGSSFMRPFSRRGSSSDASARPGPKKLTRSLSLGRSDSFRPRNIFRRSSTDRPHDGGINGNWGSDSEEEEDIYNAPPPPASRRGPPAAFANTGTLGLRGGASGSNEFDVGDDSYFTARPPPRRAVTQPTANAHAQDDYTPTPESEGPRSLEPPPRPFHRTPTGLSTKQMRKASRYEVDVEGALDICLNVEVNAKDPAGITVPYRLLVPRLFYEYTGEDATFDVDKEEAADRADLEHEEAVALEEERWARYEKAQEAGKTESEAEAEAEAGIREKRSGGGDVGGGGGGLKRWFSGRGSERGSQYRAHRQ